MRAFAQWRGGGVTTSTAADMHAQLNALKAK
jgi:hypothetical protein